MVASRCVVNAVGSKAGLCKQPNQVAHIRLAFQRPHERDDALRALAADDRRRIGKELRRDGYVAHRIGGGAAGVGNVSFVAFACGLDGREGFVGAQGLVGNSLGFAAQRGHRRVPSTSATAAE